MGVFNAVLIDAAAPGGVQFQAKSFYQTVTYSPTVSNILNTSTAEADHIRLVNGYPCWIVPQATASIGDIYTPNNPTQWWLGGTYSPPAPTYPPIEQQRADALAALSIETQNRLEVLAGTSDEAAAALARREYLLGLPQPLDAALQAESDGLNTQYADSIAISNTQGALADWINNVARNQPELHDFVQPGTASNPAALTGISWP